MKKTLTLLALLFSAAVAHGQARPKGGLVTFTWRYGGAVYGTMRVPPGFREETRNYREGIITHLRYPDSSYIILQKGGMFLIPMLQRPEYLVEKAEELKDRKSRRGRIDGTKLFWREENLRRPEKLPNPVSFGDLFPPNIAFSHVPEKRLELFNEALSSFAPSVRRPLPNKRMHATRDTAAGIYNQRCGRARDARRLGRFN